jgi:uncharacterized protein
VTLHIPNHQHLIAAIRARRLHESIIHGEHHWQCVAWVGAHLAPEVPGCDPAVVFLFALFHDAQRRNDNADPEHGLRGGDLALELHEELFHLAPAQLDRLYTACRDHTDGTVTDDPTIGVCWDADRLNLWRVAIAPDPRWLSTAPAKDPARIEWAKSLQARRFTWDAVYDAFSRLW